jgi:hypothetical protein
MSNKSNPALFPVCAALAWFSVSGCVSVVRAPYPENWPVLFQSADCLNVSGSFRNEAVDATTIEWTGATIRPKCYLSELLTRGVSDREAKLTDVEVQFRRGSVSVNSVAVSSSENFATEACTGGALQLQLHRSENSESVAASKQNIELRLYRAVDGSLVVWQHIREVGFGVLLLPYVSRADSWYRFLPEGEHERAMVPGLTYVTYRPF